ncbi:MAG: hypothetical protein WDW36_002410 [Sanguina aurantia]
MPATKIVREDSCPDDKKNDWTGSCAKARRAVRSVARVTTAFASEAGAAAGVQFDQLTFSSTWKQRRGDTRDITSRRSTEPRATEPRSTEPRSTEPRSTEPRTTEPRTTVLN